MQCFIRLRWAVLVLVGVYPNYYGYWNLFNYLNEDFWPLYRQQAYFSLTELIMSAACLYLCDRETPVSLLLSVLSIYRCVHLSAFVYTSVSVCLSLNPLCI